MFFSTVSPDLAGRIRWLVPGGSCRQILDFAELTSFEVTGRLLVGHTLDAADPREPVLVEQIIGPGDAFAFDATWPTCPGASQIGRLDGDTLLLVEHSPDCAHFAALARRAGIR